MTADPWSAAAGWREFLDLLSDAVVVFDARARVVLANTAALRLLPCEAGTPLEQLQPRLGRAAVQWLERAVAAGTAAPEPPAARLADGRAARLAWRRLDAGHSALTLVPASAPAPSEPPRASPVEGMREVIAFLWDSPFPSLLQGADFRFVEVNAAFARLIGLPREALIGRDALEFQPADEQARTAAARALLLGAGGRLPEPGVVEGRLVDAAGRERRYRATRRALHDADGRPLYLAVLQDTTAEHLAREHADRSLRELEDWFELSPVGMVLLDPGGLLLRTNPAFDGLVGVPPVALGDAPADLRALLGWDEAQGLAALDPDAPPVQRQGVVARGDAPGRLLRAVLRCYRTAGGQCRTMAIVEDRSVEDERDLAQSQLGALMDTAGVGLATFQESSGWVRQPAAARGGAATAVQGIRRELVVATSLPEFERLQQALRRAERTEARYEIDHPDLGRRWLLTRIEPATLASGKRTTSVVTLDVTEQQETQRRTEQLLRELSTILDSSTAGIAYLRGDALVRCNRRFEAMLGLAPGSALGRTIQSLFADHEAAARIVTDAWQALTHGAVYETEFAAQRLRDGVADERWYALSVRLSGSVGGQLEAIAVLSDVTRLKRQQRELEVLARAVALQAGRTRAILDSVLVGIVTVGPDGIDWMNRSARRMFGADLADFAGRPIASVAPPGAGHPFLRTDFLDTLVEGEAETFECRVRARDGREFWVVGNVVSTVHESGQRQLTYALLDIERRRQAEARVSQAQAQLQRVIEAAPLAITLRDADSLRILQINRTAAAAHGSRPEALVGLTPEELYPAPVAARRRADMSAALRSTEATRREYRSEAGQEGRVWDATWLPLASSPGAAPDQLLLIAADVTEQRADQQARLEAAIAQRDMLVKEVHHRIKNNLQGVAGLLQQIAQRKPEVAGPIAEVVGQVQAIAQVYGLQVGTGGPLRLADVVEAIAASVQRTFGRAIRFGVAGDHAPEWTLPEAEAIPIALTVNELLTNAIKHSAAVPAHEVGCLLDCAAGEVVVRVTNQGMLPPGFELARIPGGVSGLGLVRALLPRRSAALTLEQHGALVLARVRLQPPGVARTPAFHGQSPG